MHQLLSDHWPAVPLFAIGIFATGFHAIPILTVFYPAFLLYYSRQQWLHVVYAYVIASLSTTLAIMGIFDGEVESPPFQHPGLVFGLSLFGNLVVLWCLAVDHFMQHTCIWQRILVFPCMWAGSWLLFTALAPFGDIYVYSNPVLGWSDLVQATATIGGRPMIDFVLALGSTILLELKHTWDVPVFIRDEEDAGESISRPIHLWKSPIALYATFVGLLLFYGGIQTSIYPGSFFQVGYPDYVPETVPVGCVVGPGNINQELQLQHEHWFNKTTKLAEAGAKMILWSEETAQVHDPEEESTLLQRGKDIAKEHSVYIALTYDLLGPIQQNKLVLITPQGDIGIDYIKAHPVPFVEPQPAGPNVLQFVDTPEFGRVGAAICFDLNFPSFMLQASKNKIDLMLQASWTWGPIGTYHSQGNALRAVENGFTMLRCGSQGLSGVFEPVSNGLFTQHLPSVNDNDYIFNLPLRKRRWTLYGFTGDVFGYVCLVLGLGAAGHRLYQIIQERRSSSIEI
ncbi:carbon-nitrogen hydrolase [Lichtheimia hyalospora FSU 10163]|nr:carbon-nitrogen hydrolase [Lichtheimia hyalospora FSU 10163]